MTGREGSSSNELQASSFENGVRPANLHGVGTRSDFKPENGGAPYSYEVVTDLHNPATALLDKPGS